MKLKELQNKSAGELEKLVREKQTELRDLRFKVANGQLKDVRSIRKNRTDIARILTLLKQGKEKAPESK